MSSLCDVSHVNRIQIIQRTNLYTAEGEGGPLHFHVCAITERILRQRQRLLRRPRMRSGREVDEEEEGEEKTRWVNSLESLYHSCFSSPMSGNHPCLFLARREGEVLQGGALEGRGGHLWIASLQCTTNRLSRGGQECSPVPCFLLADTGTLPSLWILPSCPLTSPPFFRLLLPPTLPVSLLSHSLLPLPFRPSLLLVYSIP